MSNSSELVLEDIGIQCLLKGDLRSATIFLGRALREEGSETAVSPFFVAIAQMGVIGYLSNQIWEELFIPVEDSWNLHLTSYFRMVHASDEIPRPRGRAASEMQFASKFVRGKETVNALRYM